jgi:nucleoside phosphorylase
MPPVEAPLAVVVATAVRPETRAVLAALRGVERRRAAARPTWTGRAGNARPRVAVVEVGIGPDAVVAARSALPEARVLVSLGFAGACRSELAPGTLLLPDGVCWERDGVVEHAASDPTLLAALAAAAIRAGVPVAAVTTLLSSACVLRLPQDKHGAATRLAAAAVEMEARMLIAHAAERGASFLPVRVILDPVDLSLADLPPGLDRLAPRVRAVARPGLWPLLAALRRHAAAATAALTAVSRALLPVLVALPPPGSRHMVSRLTDR